MLRLARTSAITLLRTWLRPAASQRHRELSPKLEPEEKPLSNKQRNLLQGPTDFPILVLEVGDLFSVPRYREFWLVSDDGQSG